MLLDTLPSDDQNTKDMKRALRMATEEDRVKRNMLEKRDQRVNRNKIDELPVLENANAIKKKSNKNKNKNNKTKSSLRNKLHNGNDSLNESDAGPPTHPLQRAALAARVVLKQQDDGLTATSSSDDEEFYGNNNKKASKKGKNFSKKHSKKKLQSLHDLSHRQHYSPDFEDDDDDEENEGHVERNENYDTLGIYEDDEDTASSTDERCLETTGEGRRKRMRKKSTTVVGAGGPNNGSKRQMSSPPRSVMNFGDDSSRVVVSDDQHHQSVPTSNTQSNTRGDFNPNNNKYQPQTSSFDQVASNVSPSQQRPPRSSMSNASSTNNNNTNSIFLKQQQQQQNRNTDVNVLHSPLSLSELRDDAPSPHQNGANQNVHSSPSPSPQFAQQHHYHHQYSSTSEEDDGKQQPQQRLSLLQMKHERQRIAYEMNLTKHKIGVTNREIDALKPNFSKAPSMLKRKAK